MTWPADLVAFVADIENVIASRTVADQALLDRDAAWWRDTLDDLDVNVHNPDVARAIVAVLMLLCDTESGTEGVWLHYVAALIEHLGDHLPLEARP